MTHEFPLPKRRDREETMDWEEGRGTGGSPFPKKGKG